MSYKFQMIKHLKPKVSKYRSKPFEIDGIGFDSKAEGYRYQALNILLKAGEIRDLKVKEVFKFEYRGFLICKYECDFSYFDNRKNKKEVEDVKSEATKTRLYLVKKKLMKAFFDIDITEVFYDYKTKRFYTKENKNESRIRACKIH